MLAGASLKKVTQDSATRQGKFDGDEVKDPDAGAENVDEAGVRSTRSTGSAPECSGQAYFVGDGQPCSPRAFLDGILDGLGAVAVEGALFSWYVPAR